MDDAELRKRLGDAGFQDLLLIIRLLLRLGYPPDKVLAAVEALFGPPIPTHIKTGIWPPPP